MSGTNMESLLMGGDDSSSGDSDDEANVPAGTTAASAVPAVPANVQMQQPQQPPRRQQQPPPAAATVAKPAPSPAAPAPSPSGGQAEQLARLKSLYSSQPKRQTSQPSAAVQAASTSGRAAPAPQAQPMPAPATMQVPAPATVRPLVPNRSHSQSSSGQAPSSAHNRSQSSHKPPTHRTHPSSTSTSQHHSQPEVDPFAPTPLHRIKERHQQKLEVQQRLLGTNPTNTPAHSSQQTAHHSSRSIAQSGSSSSSSNRGPTPQDRAAMERDVRRQKEKFLMFTRVLIKYLEQKDPKMHLQAKIIIKDCAERNKRQEPGYESVTASMKERLKKLVGEQYWKRAEAYLKHFLEQKKGGSAGGGGSALPGSRGHAQPSSASTPGHHGHQSYSSSSQSQHKSSTQSYLDQEKARKLQAAAAAKQRASAPTTPTIANIRQEIANKRQQINSTATKTSSSAMTATAVVSSSTAASTPSPAPTPKASTPTSSKKQSSSKRKSTSTPTGSSRKSSSSSATPTPAPAPPAPAPAPPVERPPEPVELPPKEYSEFMEMLDHAVDYDWESAGLLLGSKGDIDLDEEQRKLLYGLEGNIEPPKPSTPPGPAPGWGQRNILSARAAWARIRLREQRMAARSALAVGDGTLTLPGAARTMPKPLPNEAIWINEEKAERDATLALFSEGCEIYLRGILEKAIHCARQRQNVDGIRLWHQQHSTPANGTKPALSLRLGCDVARQAAQAAGNAAMTCKRMEEALERQTGIPAHARAITDSTLQSATDMADLSMRPKLKEGAGRADYAAKRSFETYGGKDATQPPLGRVPKVAKLEVIDFVMGSNIVENMGLHQAGTANASVYF